MRIAADGRSATIGAADLNGVIGASAQNVTLAAVSVSGSGGISLEVHEMDDDYGRSIRLPVINLETCLNEASPMQIYTLSIPVSPLREDRVAHFVVSGLGISATRLQVYDQAGQIVHDSGFVLGEDVGWDLRGEDGRMVSNGVYLYILTFQGADGNIIRTETKKIAVLR